jgi:hypothetical protein
MNDYQRGYYAGSRGRWPEHVPPNPPHPLLNRLFSAAKELRNEADHICATISEDDDFAQKLAPRIDELDDAMIAVSKWLRLSELAGRGQSGD